MEMDIEEIEKLQMKQFEEEESEDEMNYNKNFYIVEKILDRKIENKKKLYLIKWDGYHNNKNTWEPLKNLKKVINMVKEFDRNLDKIDNNETKKKSTRIKGKKDKFEFADNNYLNTSTKLIFNSNNNIQSSWRESYHLIKQINEDKIKKELLNKMKENNSEEDKIESEEDSGNFPKDEPNQILKIVPIQNTSKYTCLIEWKVRENGYQPKNSYVENEALKEYCPLLLVKFLENSITFY